MLLKDLKPRPEIEVKSGDFLISRANTAELVARSVVVPPDVEERLMLSDKLIRFQFSKKMNVEFLNLVNSSVVARSYYGEVAGGTSNSMKNVSRSQIANLLVPVPLREEQDRIVHKIAELQGCCDALLKKFSVSLYTSRVIAETLSSRVN